MSDIGPISNKNVGGIKKAPTESSAKAKDNVTKADPNPSFKKTTESAESKITKWFTQAGVSTSRYSKLDPDQNKKLDKREQMKRIRRMENLERILERALDFGVDKSSQENIDADWFFSFIGLAENVYSVGMQDIWGKIFAAEISKPGSFSVRTLKTLQEITQREANVFQIAVSLAAKRKGEYSPKVLYGYYRKPSILALLRLPKTHQLNLAQFGLTYPDLLTLMDAGLIYSSEIESAEMAVNNVSEWQVNVRNLQITPKVSGLFLNYYKFTAIGAELSKLVNVVPNEPYIDALKKVLLEDFSVLE
ncbi:MAG: TIGR03899 family protein [Aestuariibacter sp.]